MLRNFVQESLCNLASKDQIAINWKADWVSPSFTPFKSLNVKIRELDIFFSANSSIYIGWKSRPLDHRKNWYNREMQAPKKSVWRRWRIRQQSSVMPMTLEKETGFSLTMSVVDDYCYSFSLFSKITGNFSTLTNQVRLVSWALHCWSITQCLCWCCLMISRGYPPERHG